MQNNHFASTSKQQSHQQLAASFLKNLAQNLMSAPCNDYDLARLILGKAARREFAKDIASYFIGEEAQQILEEDSEYDPTMQVDWMVAEYLAFLLDPSMDRRSLEQREKQQWKDKEKFYEFKCGKTMEEIAQENNLDLLAVEQIV